MSSSERTSSADGRPTWHDVKRWWMDPALPLNEIARRAGVTVARLKREATIRRFPTRPWGSTPRKDGPSKREVVRVRCAVCTAIFLTTLSHPEPQCPKCHTDPRVSLVKGSGQ